MLIGTFHETFTHNKKNQITSHGGNDSPSYYRIGHAITWRYRACGAQFTSTVSHDHNSMSTITRNS